MRSPTNRPSSYLAMEFRLIALIVVYVLATIGLVLIGLALGVLLIIGLALVQFAAGYAFVVYSNKDFE